MLREFQGAWVRGESLDYLSNTLVRTFPRGLDAELFRYSALEKADKEAQQGYEREHVTPYIYQHPDLFRLRNFASDKGRPDLRWTLDTEKDWEVIRFIYGRLYREGRLFSTDDVYQLYEQEPWLADVNAEVEQKGF
jgi:spore coat polysaccharide biosynthesis protein SpsF